MRFGSKKYLNLLRELTISQLKTKDQSGVLGFLWSFLNPLLMLTVIFTIFHVKFSDTTEHYAIYVLIGLVQFTHFSNTSSAAMLVLRNMSQLTGQAIFPKELLVLSVVISRSVEFVIAFAVATLIAFISGIEFSWVVLTLPFVLVLQILFVSWVSLALSWLYLLVRDIQHIYQVFLRLLLFLCPIFYTFAFLENNAFGRMIVTMNPLTHLMGYSRDLVMKGELFPMSSYMLFLAANSLLLYICYYLFKRLEPKFAELL